MTVRPFRTPLAAVAAFAGVYAIYKAMGEFDATAPYLFPAFMAVALTLLAGLITLIVWFYLFSPFGRRVRLAAGGLALAVVGAFYFSVKHVEFDGENRPTMTYAWEQTPAEKFAAYQSAAPAAPAAGLDLTAKPDDSPGFRGPAGDGRTPGPDFPAELAVRWKHPAGGGHGGVAVVGAAVVTLEQRGDRETVVCLDRATGAEVWAYGYPARFVTTENLGGGGPRTTPLVIGTDVYTVGAVGDLVCVDGRTGAKKWATNILADAGAVAPQWAVSGSPAAADDLVIVNPGVNPADNRGEGVAAYDRATGRRVWAAGRFQAAYASPQVMTLAGVRQAVVFDAGGLAGHDLVTGTELWRFGWVSDQGMNSAQPVAVGPDRVFISSEKSSGGAVVEVTRDGSAWAVRQVWKSRALCARYATPVFAAGHLFGLADGRLACVDAATGTKAWAESSGLSRKGYGNGQIVLAGTTLVISTEAGGVAVVAADPAGHRELGFLDVFAGSRTWNMPALAGRDLVVRNNKDIALISAER